MKPLAARCVSARPLTAPSTVASPRVHPDRPSIEMGNFHPAVLGKFKSALTAPPIEYDIGAGMTGTVSISNFREGVDSLALASGLTVVSDDATNSGGLMLNLSNQGHVFLVALSQG